VVLNIDEIAAAVADGLELFEMGKAEEDWDTVVAVEADAAALEKRVAEMEFRRMFANDPMDPNNCFMDIQGWFRWD
jgi:peptide chain release factor 2